MILSENNEYAIFSDKGTVSFIYIKNNLLVKEIKGFITDISPDRKKISIRVDFGIITLSTNNLKIIEENKNIYVSTLLGNDFNYIVKYFRDDLILYKGRCFMSIRDKQLMTNNMGQAIIIENTEITIYNQCGMEFIIVYVYRSTLLIRNIISYNDFLIVDHINNELIVSNTTKPTRLHTNIPAGVNCYSIYEDKIALAFKDTNVVYIYKLNNTFDKLYEIKTNSPPIILSLKLNLYFNKEKESHILNRDKITALLLASVYKKDNSPLSKLTMDSLSVILSYI